MITREEVQAIREKLCRDMTVRERAILQILGASCSAATAIKLLEEAKQSAALAEINRQGLARYHFASEGVKRGYREDIECYTRVATELRAAVQATKPHLLEVV